MASNRFPKHLFNQQDLIIALDQCAEISGACEFIVGGSQAILASHPLGNETLRRSTDIDMYPNVPLTAELKSLIDEQVGGFSAFHDEHLWEIETVGPWMLLSALPGWEERCVIFTTPKGVVAKCLCPLDIAYNKAEAGRPKDIEYLAALFYEKIVLPSQIKEAMEAAAIHESIAVGVRATIQAAILMNVAAGK